MSRDWIEEPLPDGTVRISLSPAAQRRAALPRLLLLLPLSFFSLMALNLPSNLRQLWRLGPGQGDWLGAYVGLVFTLGGLLFTAMGIAALISVGRQLIALLREGTRSLYAEWHVGPGLLEQWVGNARKLRHAGTDGIRFRLESNCNPEGGCSYHLHLVTPAGQWKLAEEGALLMTAPSCSVAALGRLLSQHTKWPLEE